MGIGRGIDSLVITVNASKETVYVISQEGRRKYVYNKKGLLMDIVDSGYHDIKYDKDNHIISYSYDGYVNDSGDFVGSYSSNGQLEKIERYDTYARSNPSLGVYQTYNLVFNKKGQLMKQTVISNRGGFTSWYKYQYNNDGLLKCRISDMGSKEEYKYDSNGNIDYIVNTVSFKNVYDSRDLLTKRKSSGYTQVGNVSWRSEHVTKYQYKKLYVPSNMVERIEHQQWIIRNSEPFSRFYTAWMFLL